MFATDLAEGLSDLGVLNTVVALAPGVADDSLDIDVLGPSRRSRTTVSNLRRLAPDHDVVVAHGSSTLVVSALALTGTKVPFVYRQISDPEFWAATWPRRVRVAALIRRARVIVALSHGSSAVLRSHYRLDGSRISVIPNAVPERSSADEDRRDDSGPVELLYLGALAAEKGVDFAVRAAAAVDEARLTVAGAGPERSALEALASDLAPDRITFIGSVDDPRSLLASSDILLLPSRGGDSMPAVLIEAGLQGLACVTTPVGSITDIVLDGETGRVVPVGDQSGFSRAVADLVAEPGVRSRLGAAARDHCTEHFTIGIVAPKWLDVLRSVL